MHYICQDTPIQKMGVTEINIWILIRRYDKLEGLNNALQTSLHCFTVLPGLTLDELRTSICYRAGIENDNSRVIKIRAHNEALIPLSALLRGSQKDKPFIIDIVTVHQFCPVEKRTIPPGCVDALKLQLSNLEKRVLIAESHLPELCSSHTRAIEMMAAQLTSCVSFLDRRLDELAPPEWKEKIKSTV